MSDVNLIVCFNMFIQDLYRYLYFMFKFVTDFSQRQTRFVDNSKLYLPIGNHLKVFTGSFQYAAGAVWNKLPVHIR